MSTRIEWLKKPALKKPVLYTGLPGIGLVGKIAVDYLLKQLKAQRIGLVYSDTFPPAVHTEAGVLNLISDEIYLVEWNSRHYLFLAGPVQPSLDGRVGTGRDHYEFAHALVSAFQDLGVKEFYTLAGINIGDRRMEKEPQVVIAATDQKVLDEFKKFGVLPGQEGGLISGAAGLILGEAKKAGLQGACLMGETHARLIYGDHGAAKKVLELLVKRHGFNLDMSGIKKESKAIEEAFSTLTKEITKQIQKVDELEGSPSYVR